MVACFRYASIDVYSVYLPPAKVDFNYELQGWIQKEVDEVVKKADLLFSEVCNSIRQILEKKYCGPGVGIKCNDLRLATLEKLLQNEKKEFEERYQKFSNREAQSNQPAQDILEINRLRKQLLFQSYLWDHRLVSYAKNDRKDEDKDFPNDDFMWPSIFTRSNDAVTSGEAPSTEKKDVTSSNLEGATNAMNPLETAFQTSGTPVLAERLALDTQVEEKGILKASSSPSPIASTNSKASGSSEASIGWLGMPFVHFYRSFNKTFFGSAQKLDRFSGYNSMYISEVQETGLQDVAKWLLPEGLNRIVIPVYDDEPTSIISYALTSQDYHSQLSDDGERHRDLESASSLPLQESASFHQFLPLDEPLNESNRSLSIDDSVLSNSGAHSAFTSDPLLYAKSLHTRVSFTVDGPLEKLKYTVTFYYAKHFDALRKMCCPSELDFVRSLSRCKKWGAQGGKSNVFFAKTLDDRFIIKQVTKTELESFFKFAPDYFKYLMEAINTKSPTCLAKILGIYQVTTRNLKTGKETKIDVLVMENLLFRRTVSRLYDLKGSLRSRYNPDSNGNNKVLLDQNLIEAMPTSPIFVGNKAKRLLERAVWNDTSFLASVDVMDYSLLVGVDKDKRELVLGIIDFMRQYTWDKHLETWVKGSMILGGPKNESPTVISPQQYKKRFQKAMTTYFLMVPDTWTPPNAVPTESSNAVPTESQSNSCEENAQSGS